jgi:hypothetical protein
MWLKNASDASCASENLGMRSIWLFKFAADTTAGCRQADYNLDQADYVALKTPGMTVDKALMANFEKGQCISTKLSPTTF